jgi:hypothetical protein
MGAARVIAVNVGDLSDPDSVSSTMLGVAGDTLDAMMRASTRRALISADVLINVPLKQYGSLDWRRAAALIDEGYRAAEAMRDQLLPRRERSGVRCSGMAASSAPAGTADSRVHKADGFVASDTAPGTGFSPGTWVSRGTHRTRGGYCARGGAGPL